MYSTIERFCSFFSPDFSLILTVVVYLYRRIELQPYVEFLILVFSICLLMLLYSSN
jgi:hypothetical protein